VHWPPCPSDQLATKWMPLASARLTPDGIEPSTQTTAELDRLAAVAACELAAEQAREAAAARARDERNHAVVRRPAAGKVGATSDVGQFPGTHEAFRWDAFPPEADPDTWCFGCNTCGLELTGAMLKVSPVVHVIRTMERTRAGRPREIELRYGAHPAQAKCRPPRQTRAHHQAGELLRTPSTKPGRVSHDDSRAASVRPPVLADPGPSS